MLPRHLCPHTDLDEHGNCAECNTPREAVDRDLATDTVIADHLRAPIVPPAPRRRVHADR